MRMPRGPVPKENPQRRNDGPAKRLGEAPTVYPPLGDHYSFATIEWYETWAKAEQASQFTGTDWQRLRMLAPLVELYFTNPTKDLMAEIRQNESKLGATAEDRQRLRWKIAPSEGDEEPEPEKPRARERKDPRTRAQ